MRLLLLLLACAPSARDIDVGARKDLGDPTDHNFVPDGGAPDGAPDGDGGGVLPAGPFSVPQGLFGGTIEAVAVAPGAVYIATGGAGVFKSTDNGDHFVAASAGMGPSTVSHIVVDPTQPASLWAVSNKGARNSIFSNGEHVYHSSDGAASWTELTPSPLPMPEDFRQIAVAGNDVYMLGSPAVYHSSDGGQTWASNPSVVAAPDGPVDLALDPTNPKTAYMLTGRGFLKSIDDGVTWPSAGAGLPAIPVGGAYLHLAVDPKNPGTVYLGASGIGSGIFQSIDHGDHFTDMHATGNQTYPGLGISVDPDITSILYMWDDLIDHGLLKSGDSGAHWAPFSLGVANDTVMSFAAVSSSTLFTGWDLHGVRRSLDSGATWSDANNGITNVSIFALAYANAGVVYAGAGDGTVRKSSDGGKSWSAPSGALDPQLKVTSLSVHPSNPDVVYAGADWTGETGTTRRGGLFKSIDGGMSWFALDLGQQKNLDVFQVLVDPQNPKNVYASGDGAIIKSTDEGVSFTTLLPGVTDTLVIDAKNSQIVYAVGTNQLSLDGGASWQPWTSTTLLPDGRNVVDEVIALAIDPTNDMRMYMCTSHGLFRSDDGGNTFNHAGVGFSGDAGCSLLTLSGSTLYALSVDRKLFGSSDGATTWAPLAFRAFDEAELTALAVSPSDAGTALFGLAYSVGVLRTETGGR